MGTNQQLMSMFNAGYAKLLFTNDVVGPVLKFPKNLGFRDISPRSAPREELKTVLPRGRNRGTKSVPAVPVSIQG